VRTLVFDFHGVVVEVVTDDAVCETLVERDFSMFRIRERGPTVPRHIHVLVSRREPPCDQLPRRGRSWIRTKDAAVYHGGGRRFLYTSGRALVILDFRSERAEIYSMDRELLHEKSYLMIMSRVGEWLDRRGLHRLHAMGVVCRGRSVLCLMPMGGGKTTLALGLLGRPEFALLSEEAPLVSRDGRLHPFPIRIGVSADTEPTVPDEFLTPFRRTRHGPKTLIDARYFADRIALASEPGILLVGRRGNGAEPSIAPMGRLAAFRALWDMGVRARGIPQLLEYVLRADPRAVFARLRVLLSRILACLRLLGRSECYELRLGHDLARNVSRVTDLAYTCLGSGTTTPASPP
jgi:hypothetical protein